MKFVSYEKKNDTLSNQNREAKDQISTLESANQSLQKIIDNQKRSQSKLNQKLTEGEKRITKILYVSCSSNLLSKYFVNLSKQLDDLHMTLTNSQPNYFSPAIIVVIFSIRVSKKIGLNKAGDTFYSSYKEKSDPFKGILTVFTNLTNSISEVKESQLEAEKEKNRLVQEKEELYATFIEIKDYDEILQAKNNFLIQRNQELQKELADLINKDEFTKIYESFSTIESDKVALQHTIDGQNEQIEQMTSKMSKLEERVEEIEIEKAHNDQTIREIEKKKIEYEENFESIQILLKEKVKQIASLENILQKYQQSEVNQTADYKFNPQQFLQDTPTPSIYINPNYLLK